MLTVLLTLTLAAPAHADELAYQTCCNESGAYACPETISLVGPGTVLDDTGVKGLWMLTCRDGASFFPHAGREVSDVRPGQVLTAMDAMATGCFDAACPLPSGVCLESSPDGTVRAVQCGTRLSVDEQALVSAPSHRTAVVAGADRVVRVDRLSVDAARARVIAQLPAAPEALVETRPAPAPPPPAPIAPVGGSEAAPQPSARPRRMAGSDEPLPPTGPTIDWTMPQAPTFPCVPPRERIVASNEQNDLGDEALVAGDLGDAVGHWRAALQVNVCNGYAWASLGRALADEGYASRARDALDYATRLVPSNVRAWAELGRAQMELGDKAAAIEAFHQALELRPGYLPAEQGLRDAVRN